MISDAKDGGARRKSQCKGSPSCPLSKVDAGSLARISHLDTTPDVRLRLRELGLCEDQTIKVVSCQPSFICQVCNSRIGLSRLLADQIFVQPLAVKKNS
jgi:Fe2+ transport system protein FeoA